MVDALVEKLPEWPRVTVALNDAEAASEAQLRLTRTVDQRRDSNQA